MQTVSQMMHMPLLCSIKSDGAELQHLAKDSTAAATTDTVCKSIMDVLMADNTTSCAPFIIAGGSAVSHYPAINNRDSPFSDGHSLKGAKFTAGAAVAAVAGPMPLQQISTDTLNGQLLLLQGAAKDAAICKQRKDKPNIAAKQHDQVSKQHLEEPVTDAKHLQSTHEKLQAHNPKRQKLQDLDTICNAMLQQLAACIQHSGQTQQQGNGFAVTTEPNHKRTSSAPRAVRSTFGSAEANQPMEVDVADEDAAALGLIMMLHSRENSDEEGPQQPTKTLGANRLTSMQTVEHNMQQQHQRHKRRRQDQASSLHEASALHSKTAAARVHEAADGSKAVGCVQGAVTCFRSGALPLQHKLDFFPAQAKVNTQHVTAEACVEPAKAAAQAALSAAGIAAGTPRVAAQLLKQIQGLLQQQQGRHESAGHAAATASETYDAAAAVATESASSLLPANLFAAAAAPWYPCGGKGGLMLLRNGKLVARKLYCMQTGTILTSAAGALRAEICGIKRAGDRAVEQQQQQVQLAKQPRCQQQADAGDTAVSSVPADKQAGVQLLLDAAAAGDMDAACDDDLQQHSVKQLTDEEMLARMRQRQHKTSMQPMSNSSCQQATAWAETATAATNSRPSRSRKAPAKLEDTVPTEAVLAGMNRSKPVVSQSLSSQQQQQHWHLQDMDRLQKQEQHPPLSLFQQHLQVHASSTQQQHQPGRQEVNTAQLPKQQLHNNTNHKKQQQQGKGVCGLPLGMSIIAGLSTRQLNAALAAARATAPRAATTATDAELNLSATPPAGIKASTDVIAKPAMAASLPLTKESAAHAAHSGSTTSRSAGDIGMLCSSALGGSSAAEQAIGALAAAAGEKQVGSGDAAAMPAASAEAAGCSPQQACGCAADGGVNSSSLAAMQGGDKGAAGSPAEASLEVPGVATEAAAVAPALMPAKCSVVLSSATAVEAGLKVPGATGAAAAAASESTTCPAVERNAAAVQASLKLLPAATGAAAGLAFAQSPAAELSPAAASEVAAAAAAVADAAHNLKRRLKPGKTKLQTNRPDPMIRSRSQMEVILLEQQRIKVQEMLKRHRQRQQQQGVAAVAGDKQLQTAAGHDKQQEQQQQQQSGQQEAGAPAQRQQAPKSAKRPWMSLAPQRSSNPATTVPFAAQNPRGVSPDAAVSAAGSAVSAGRVFIVPAAAVMPSAAAAAAVLAAGKSQSVSSAAPISGTAAAVAGPVKTAPDAAGSAAGAPGRTVVMQAPYIAIPPPPAAAAANKSVAVGVMASTTAGAGPAATAGKQCAVAASAAPNMLTAAVQLASTQQQQQQEEQQQRACTGVCAMSSASAAAPQPRTAATTASSLRAKLLAALSADDDCDDKQAPAAATAAQASATQSTLATGTPVNSVAAAAQQGKGSTLAGPQPAGMANVGTAQQHNGTVAAAAKAAAATHPTAVVLQRIPGSGLVGVPVYVPGMTSQQVVAHVQQQHRQLLLASIQEQQRKQLVQGTAAVQQKAAAVVVGHAPGVGGSHQVPAGR